jgi:hypothetical protein
MYAQIIFSEIEEMEGRLRALEEMLRKKATNSTG